MTPLDERSLHLRRLVVDALEAAGSGHVGPSLSPIEILRVLYDDILHVNPAEPERPDRDRFILSKGHGCLALYAVLADKGFFSPSLLRTFCAYGSPLGGHPELHTVPGVEWSTGALGHGLSVAVGIALGLRIRRSGRVYVLCGDGELDEGSVWEAALSAAHHRLDTLCVLVDRNGVQSCGRTEVILGLEPLAAKWQSFGFEAITVDGHDLAQLRSALSAVPMATGKPTAIICRTVKGRGLPFAEGQAGWHHQHGIDSARAASMRAALASMEQDMSLRQIAAGKSRVAAAGSGQAALRGDGEGMRGEREGSALTERPDAAAAEGPIAAWRTRDEALNAGHVRAFRRDGLLIMRDVLSPAELASLDREVTGLIDWAWQTGRHEDIVWTDEPGSLGAVPVRIEYPMDKSRAVLSLAGHPVLLAAVEALIGPNLIPTWDSLVFKVEQGAPGLPWHRDSGIYDHAVAVTGAGRVIDVGIYLDPAPPDNCVWALPGSCYWSHDQAELRLAELNSAGWPDESGVPAVMRPGDVLIHNILTLHGAPPVTGSRRRVVYFEYRPAEVEYYLGPHNREYIGLKQQVLLESMEVRQASEVSHGEKPFEYQPAETMRLWGDVPLSTVRFPHQDYWAWADRM